MTTAAMTPGERVRAALKGEAVDRVPFCFWHHFKPEGSGERMAELTMEFFRTKFDLDIVKIMPDLLYPAPEPAVTQAAQWSSLPRLGLDTPGFRDQFRPDSGGVYAFRSSLRFTGTRKGQCWLAQHCACACRPDARGR